MSAALNRSRRRFEPERRYTGDLVERPCVVKQQMLSSISQKADGAGRVHGNGMAGRDAVIILDLIGVAVVVRTEQEQAHTCHSFQPIDPVSIECDMERVGITLHASSHNYFVP